MTKVLRTFRVCGEGRTPPTGTLAILQEGDGSRKALFVPDDASRRDLYLVSDLTVHDVPERTAGTPDPTGLVVAQTDHGEQRWHFFKELPVSADRIHQTITKVPMIPRVEVKK